MPNKATTWQAPSLIQCTVALGGRSIYSPHLSQPCLLSEGLVISLPLATTMGYVFYKVIWDRARLSTAMMPLMVTSLLGILDLESLIFI